MVFQTCGMIQSCAYTHACRDTGFVIKLEETSREDDDLVRKQ